MPGRAEFAAAADAGVHPDAAVLQPQLAHRRAVVGRLGDREAAVRVEDGRVGAIERHALRVHDEVRDLRAVLGRGLELLHLVARGVELRRQRAQQLGLRALEAPLALRLQVAGHRQPGRRRVLRRGGDPDRGVVGQRDGRARPGAVLRVREDLRAAAHVVQHGHDQARLRAGHRLDGLARGGREEDGGLQRVGLRDGLRQVDGHEHALLELRAGGGPVFLDLDDQLAVEQLLDAGLLGQAQRADAGGRQQVRLGFEERDAALDDHRLVALRVGERADLRRHVGLLAAEDLHRRREGLAALQALDDEGVAGLGQFSRRPFAGHDERVDAVPGRALLALGQLEAAFDEGALAQVELAHGDRVLAAVGQREQAAVLVRRLALGAFPDPVAMLGLGHLVEIQHGLPRRGAARVVVLGRRHAPDAAHVLGVLPEVPQAAVDLVRERDAILRLGQGQRLRVVAREARIGLQRRQRLLVLGTHPGHRLGAVDLLQPDVRIVGGGGGRSRHGGRGSGAAALRQHGAGCQQGDGRGDCGQGKTRHGGPGLETKSAIIALRLRGRPAVRPPAIRSSSDPSLRRACWATSSCAPPRQSCSAVAARATRRGRHGTSLHRRQGARISGWPGRCAGCQHFRAGEHPMTPTGLPERPRRRRRSKNP